MNKLLSDEQTLYQLFDLIEEGHLTLINHEGKEYSFGKPGTSPSSNVIVRDPKVYRHILSFGSLGFGESYMYGWWDEENDNIVDFTGLLLSSGVYSKAKGNISLIFKILYQRLLSLPAFIENSRDNAQYHYDLGNSFYKLFLDSSMTYSCGYQIEDTDTLEEMQTQKYELICRKLNLQPEENIIDIGCGWGGMLIYAAEKYGIRGTGVTLSEEQADFAKKAIAQRGLSDRIKIEISDYRNIEGQYDKFVSIGMFEHVGKGNFSVFINKVSELLKPNGIGLLHTIGTVGGGRDPWIEKYIFPGGFLPKMYEISQEMQNFGFLIAHCENLKPHYARTLRLWSENFRQNRKKIENLGEKYDRQFMRMWDLYLQVCEATFSYGNSQLYQVLFSKGKKWQLPTNLDFKIDRPNTAIWQNLEKV